MFDNTLTALDLATEARDVAEAVMLGARNRSGSAARALEDARSTLAAAKANRSALVQAALDGKTVDPAGLRRLDKAIDDAEQSVRFNTDVARAADDALRMATDAYNQTCREHHLQQLASEQQQFNDDMAARCPEQPTDAELLAVARLPGTLGVAERGILIAYDRAYHRHIEPGPVYTPRARIIQESQMVAEWLRWAKHSESTDSWNAATAPGAMDRSMVRRMRIALAATEHFERYLGLSWDDLRRLHGQDYARIQGGLPRLASGMVAPCAFAPL